MKPYHVSPSSAKPVYHCTGVVVLSGYFYSVQTTFGRYDNVASVVGRCNLKDEVYIQFGDPKNRRHPIIIYKQSKVVSEARRRSQEAIIEVLINYWLQSNQDSSQSVIGGKVNPSLLDFSGSTTFWNLPTSDETGTLHEGVRPYGLVRFQFESKDLYGCAWPYLKELGGFGWKMGAWDIVTRVPQWEVEFGSTGSDFENVDSPKHRLFADPLTGWIHSFPEIGSTPSRIMSAKDGDTQNTSTISRDQGTSNASLKSFKVTIGEETEIQSWFVFPSVDSTTAGGQASITFCKMNTDGSWEEQSAFDSAYIPNGGPSVVPDCLAFGNPTFGPVPWLRNRAVVFSSGGQRGLFGSDQWEKNHWTVRALDVNGVNSVVLASRTINATASPRVLSTASLKSQATSAPYTLNWDGGANRWIGGGCELGSDTSSDWAYIPNLAPILLPTDSPNRNRVTTLESALSITSIEARRWPPELRNFGGGISVDSSNTVWLVIVESEQILYGGTYSIYDSGLTQDTWVWRYNNGCFSSTISGIVSDGIHPVSGAPGNPTPGSPVTKQTVDGCSPGFDRFQVWSFDATSPTQWPLWKFRYTQKPGWLQRMKLIGIRTNGVTATSMMELDISQKADITINATLGGGASGLGGAGSASYTLTETDFPLVGNSWQAPMSFPDRNIVCLLVDRLADGLNKNPTPHLETYGISGSTLSLISTVRLGSYTELKLSDNTSIEPGWFAGDQEWDPYASGGPRMKACRKDDENKAPLILAIVSEMKKVDIDTDSQFKRVCYALVDLEDPSSPVVSRVSYTSPDLGVGNSGDIPENFPLLNDWDTLILTPGHVAWIRDSKFRETINPPP